MSREQKEFSPDMQVAELIRPNAKYPDKNLSEKDIERAEAVSGGFKEINVKRYWNGTKFVVEFDCKERTDILNLLKMEKPLRIFFTKFDRLSRDFSFLQQFVEWCKDNGIELCPLNDSSEDIVRQILSVLGQDERKKTQDRVISVQKQLFLSGIHPYRCPFGYFKKPKGNPDRKMYVDKKKAEIVKQVFEMTLEGVDYKEICSKLKIFPNLYYDIIKNDIYIGRIHFGNETKQGLHEPIISSELFDKVQAKISHVSKTL